MSPDAIDCAIAEFCGWTEFSAPIEGSRRYGIRPDSAGEKYPFAAVPQYHRCLNAMAEARSGLSHCLYVHDDDGMTTEVNCYLKWLVRMTGGLGNSVDATAAQRAEALLRTIGKYQEPEKLSTHQAV